MSAPQVPRLLLRCTCCQKEILAEILGDLLLIRTKRHGQEHQLVIRIDKYSLIEYALPADTLHPTRPVTTA